MIVVFFVSFYASYDVSMQKRESLKFDEAEIPPAALTDLETELENEKVPALPKTFQHTSDNAFRKEEITGVDLDNAMDIGAELQPIKEASLDEIKQSDHLKGIG